MIAAPMCACCGIPFVVAMADEMQCPECLGHAAAYATKFWPGVPEFRLHWDANRYVDDPDVPGRRRIAAPRDQLGKDERLALAERTASMLCPHCGASLTDAQRREMIDAALRDATDAAVKRGVFGVPTFITTVETESFSGYTWPELLDVYPDAALLDRVLGDARLARTHLDVLANFTRENREATQALRRLVASPIRRAFGSAR